MKSRHSTFIKRIAFHKSGKPRRWVRFLIIYINKKPCEIFKRIVYRKSGSLRDFFTNGVGRINKLYCTKNFVECEYESNLKNFIPSQDPINTDIRAIAIYLPQFHAIPENDQWWGEGFTEWTNVRRATPQYAGHYQPHTPHSDIGYYDLDDASVLEKQAAMARAAGIEGFCFYYYWFNGRRLLNMPTDRMLATGKPDFPFCFCWANENWTRTWDGGDKEILIGQEHSDESDERFILDLLPAFRDPRYIRVEGKPLLIVYRPGLLPDPAATARHWRETCRREGIGEIFLARMQMFDWELEGRDPGYDTVIQFPPVSRGFSPSLKTSIQLNDPKSFVGEIYDYRASAENYSLENIGKNLWPGVCPSWDNTARRMERGHSWVNSSPEDYHKWLSKVLVRARQALPPQQRFVFINAWNEWAEGCHLEPDEKFGYAWLNATRLAITNAVPHAPQQPRRRLLVVGHDACRAGAQIVLLALLREWKQRQDVECRLILLGDGVLRPEFENACRTLVLSDHVDEASRNQALANYFEPAPDVILANTVVIGPFLKELKSTGAAIVTYVHELQKSIERWAPGEIMAATVADSDHFIAVSSPVADNLVRNHGIATSAISLIHEYIKTRHFVSFSRLEELRAELGLQPSDKVVFGCGTMDWRKGPDLFAEIARKVLADVPEARFVWIGADNNDEAGSRAKALADHSRISFIGERETPRDYLALGSAFLLSSREDPFPLVSLEAADAGLPTVCFAGAGGMPDFVGNSCGRTVPFEDVDAATRALTEILSNPSLRESLGHTARESVRAKHDAAKGSDAVLSVLKHLAAEAPPVPPPSGQPLVSVIVPNYNHARFLPERLESIARQTLADFEIILLDDCSTDDSLDILREFADREPRARLILNSENSGSTFKQWRKGLSEACGKYIWIAESDDSAHPELLATLVGKLEANPAAVLATCCPQMTDICGKDLGTPRDWFSDIGAERWESDFSASGREMIADVLSQKNAILNASGVLFRRSVGTVDLVEDSMRLCADWLFWVRLLARGDFEYSARPLNLWRLASSNARTKPPGETEWNEGKIVLRETASIMGVDKKEELLLLSNFRKRCEKWLQTIPAETVTESQVSIEANDSPLRTKVIAIHLPQFHPFRENNEWWGEGFTEWTNVRKNQALFPGHAQPRIPSDLGYYDLRSPEVRAAQANLARDHGIDGFCYYHYWFHGHRLMTEPLDAIFESGEPDFPFCLCWANETWSRRWLGEERDILIAQTYSEADNFNHAHFLAKVFSDKRYIRIGNRPLFIVYRPTHIDVLEHFLTTLRKVCIDAGVGDPFILGCSAHAEGTDMRTLGFNGTMDFQPKLGFLPEAFEDNPSPERLARNRALGVDSPNLRLYDAKDLRRKIDEYRDQLDYPVQPSVFVGWDSTPRRGENGIILMNNTPENFANSFESATRYLDSSKFDGEKVVFINAWNEWAEGNYLEPDSLNGKKYLEFLKAFLLEKKLEDISTSSSIPNVKRGENTFLKQSSGWCPICEKKVTFSAKYEWLRDHYLCSDCGSIPRERALMHVIQERYPKWRDLRIHESSPGNRGASVKLREQCKHYVASQYDPVLGFGNTHPKNGYRSEDLEKQTFPEKSFDIVVTQDVMEHIFDAEAAFKDIHRTLKPGGAHIFTTPLINKKKPTQQWAKRMPDGSIAYLHPPEYHGNPMSNEGSLVTWHWGCDIVDYIQRAKAGTAEIVLTENPEKGIAGEYLEVIFQKK
jgi:lipopolysaccharide biosynthesis protein/glycosyltransferase involved in cell wall biosynthesis/nitrogen regulatory protein PII